MAVLWLPGPPAPEEEQWPTLGPQIIEFMEDNLVFGPGDLLGEPYRLNDEQKALICYWYEVYPDDHILAGRRRYKRVVLSLAKGLAKTELAAAVACCEMSASSPVRTMIDERTGRPMFHNGVPIGGPIIFPFVPMAAYTEEQTEDLAYGAARVMLENSAIAHEFDIGLERIVRLNDGGEMKAVASSPNAADGARTSFQHFDEIHRFVLPKHKAAHQTMLNNIPKRRLADAWTLETTTTYGPGEGSIAEGAHDYARKVAEGLMPADPTLFYFHRQAGDEHDIRTITGRRAAVIEASGPSGQFRDIEAVVNLYDSPDTDKAYFERVWTNRPVQAERKAFDLEVWDAIAKLDELIPAGAKVVLGFDGSRFDDSTSLRVRDIRTGHSVRIGLWEKPDGAVDWEVPRDQVDAAVDVAFSYFDVWRMYCDPAYWQDAISAWAGKYGSDRVIEWWTNRPKQMVYAVKAFIEAMKSGAITHDGDQRLRDHIGNACKVLTSFRDDKGQPLFYISKERPDSPFKMDEAMTEILTNEARNDAITAGVLNQKPPAKPRFFTFREGE